MNKGKTGIILSLLIFFVWLPCHDSFAQEINMDIDIILASQRSNYIDGRISHIQKQLQNIFNFSSYKLYGHRKLIIPMGQEKNIQLLEGKVFILKPLYYQGNWVIVQAKIIDVNRLIVDTQFRVSQGGTFFVGGPKTSKGVIILKVTAH